MRRLLFLLLLGRTRGYFYFCDLSFMQPVALQFNSSSGSFHKVDDRRRLGYDRIENLEDPEPSWVVSDELVDRRASLSLNDNTTVRGRLCICARSRVSNRDYYCPVERSFCAIPRNGITEDSPPTCFAFPDSEIFARSVWPVAFVWMGLVLLFCVLTRPGHNACHGCISICFPQWTERLARRIAERQPRRAQHLVRNYWLRRQRYLQEWYRETIRQNNLEAATSIEVELARSRAPMQLVLRTRRFESSDRIDDDDDKDGDDPYDPNTCSVCFEGLVEGDKIGSLHCGHLFHAKCLKIWITRRNCCPLCIASNIAVPRDGSPLPVPVDTESLEEEML